MKLKTFKHRLTRLASTAALVLVGVAVFGTQSAEAGIANTKHNLGTAAGSTGVNKFSGTGEICVFCHTPHGSDTSAAVPLWNRTMANPNTYTTYNSLGTSSLDGATAPVGSVSLACLSCHDGTQAMNVLINEPGSGKAVAAFGAGTWSGANQTAGKLNSDLITYLGVDLKNDHPVGIQYGGGPNGAIPAAGTQYTSFNDTDFSPAESQLINNQTVWWVETGTTGRQKTDIQLYTRVGADKVTYNAAGVRSVSAGALTGAQPYVECASCHDPHVERATFLRIENTGSAVCLACHTK